MPWQTGFDGLVRALGLAAVVAMTASACTFLFPLDDSNPRWTDDAGSADAGDAASDAPLGAYAAEVRKDKPLLYLRFGDPVGATVAHDETGQRSPKYGPEVRLGAAGAILGDPDKAAGFTGALGSSVSINAGLDFQGTQPFSVEVWVEQEAIDAGTFGWAIDHQAYGNRNGWGLRFSYANIAFERWQDNKTWSPLATPGPATKGTYQHVVGTYDGATMVLYVDGHEVGRRPSTVAMPSMTSSWSIGAQNCGCSSDNFIGSLDELAIYGEALNADRVAAHYHASGR